MLKRICQLLQNFSMKNSKEQIHERSVYFVPNRMIRPWRAIDYWHESPQDRARRMKMPDASPKK